MSKKQQAIELWRACFNDTEEFIQFYFANKYQDENTLLSFEGDTAIAVIQMLPYPMNWCGRQIATSYISGACTLPGARSKGTMKKLLAESFAAMKSRHIALGTLIPAEPWLFDYYHKMGYTTVFDYTSEEHNLTPSSDNPAGLSGCAAEYSGIPEQVYPWFTRKMNERTCCVQHPMDDFTTILQDLYTDGGKLITARDHTGAFAGIAFAIPYENTTYILDLLYDSAHAKQALLQAAANEWGNCRIKCKVAATSSPGIHQGMARVIDAEQMLAIYAGRYPDKEFSLQLTDAQLPSNNGYYYIKHGICSHLPSAGGTPDFNMDIQTLTQVLLGYHLEQLPPEYSIFETQHPFMSLMLD